MTTITGKIESAAGETLHAVITFTSLSTPQFPPTIVQVNTIKRIKSLAADGTFSVQLAAGNFRVNIRAKNLDTVFLIAVPEGDETISIEDLVTSTVSTLPGVAPYTVWNGQRAGHITFLPIADPPAPMLSEVAYEGGTVTDSDGGYFYAISYVTTEGETALGAQADINASGDPDKAIRVTLPVNPSRVISKRIWRVLEGTYRLVAEIAPEVAFYDDWEANTIFGGRDPFNPGPSFNTTAGIIYSSTGMPQLYFSSTGLRALAAMQFDADARFDAKLRFKHPTSNTILDAQFNPDDESLEFLGEDAAVALKIFWGGGGLETPGLKLTTGILQKGDYHSIAAPDHASAEIAYGSGNYPNEGYSHEYRIHAYRDLGGGKRVYSEALVPDPHPLDDNSNFDDSYSITVAWPAVEGATGYRILKSDGYNGFSFDAGYDLVGASSFVDGDGSMSFTQDGPSSVVTPVNAGPDFLITDAGKVALPGDNGTMYQLSIAVVDSIPTLQLTPLT